MSFVSRLRMANMFPVNSDLGDASIRMDGDEINNIIARVRDLSLNNPMQRPVGMQMVSGMGRQSTIPQPMKFGGVFNSGPNPGAEINARAGQDVRDIYEGYKRPLNPQVSGPSNDELYAKEYFDRQNKEKLANAALENAKGNAAYKQGQVDSKGWKVVTITDPNNPSRQINARINEITGETQPITLPNNGIITPPSRPGDFQKNLEADEQKAAANKSIKSKAQEALNVLNDIVDEKTGKLKPNTQWVTGLSANFGTKFTPKGASAVADIERLKNMLTLDLIGEMKAQSKTGATGFGQMNLRELGVLENAASKLDARRMDEDEYAKELGRIRERLNQIIQPDISESKTETTNVSSNDKLIPPKAPEGYEYVRRPDNKGWTAIKKVGK